MKEIIPIVVFSSCMAFADTEWELADFSFKKLYASVDAMPMRQREMR